MDKLAGHFLCMAENNLWSNHRLQQACLQLSEADYLAPRESFFGSIHATLVHILVVDQAYTARISDGKRPDGGVRLGSDHPDLASLAAAQKAHDRELIAFCAEQDAASLARIVRFTNSEGIDNADPVAAVLTHLFAHQIHHRGQVHQLLATTAVPPPQLDEFFLSGDGARRADELAALDLAD